MMDFSSMASLTVCLGVMAVVFLLLTVFSVAAGSGKSDGVLSGKGKEDWLFGDFHHTVYSMLYKKEPEGKMMGLNIALYRRQCTVLHVIPDEKRAVAMRAEGLLSMTLFLCAAMLMMQVPLMTILFLICAVVCLYGLYLAPTKDLEKRHKKKIAEVEADLPTFLVLLDKAMVFPIDQAILITARKFDSPLSDDLIACVNKVSLGAEGWQGTLMELSESYGIRAFSDFVLDAIHAYEQGADVRAAVARRALLMEKQRSYDEKEADAKIKSTIFIPILITKVIPLMAIACIPMLMQVSM